MLGSHLVDTSEQAPATRQGAGPRVVLLDGRPERRKVMRAIIEQAVGQGTVVAEAGTAAEALASISRQAADVAVVEIQLPVADGVAAVAALRVAHRSLRIVVCTFHRDAVARQQARDAGADDYVVKPVSGRDLRRALTSSAQPTPMVITRAGAP